MNALAPYIAALHQQNLLDEAELGRKVRLVHADGSSVSAWRRNLGGGARRLSNAFASAARSLDPSIEAARAERAARSTEIGVGRALAC
jgi:hypothetical protein